MVLYLPPGNFCCTLLFICLLSANSIVVAQFSDVSGEFGYSGGGKAAFADFDNDGFVDLYSGKLWRNENGKKFVEATESGIGGGEGIWGDYDNDGQVDLFTFTGTGALYRNLGGGKFESVKFPELPTRNSRGAVWIDLNNDGLLDLYVGGYEIWQQAVHPDVAYLNRGKDGFEEVWRSPENFSARGVAAADYDGDGFVDVYVSNYRLQPNFLWKNNGKNGFENVAEQLKAHGIPDQVIGYTGGIRYPICGHTIGSCFSDIDNDGLIDIFVGNFSHPRPGQDHPQFLKNGGKEKNFAFEDKSESAGLAWQESYASPAFADFNNDGLLDLYFTTVYGVGSGNIRNYPVLYQGKGDWKFEDVTAPQKVNGLPPTYQAAWADLDNDGDLDLCTAGKIFRNDNQATGKWLKIVLSGDGKRANRSGIGATVRIRSGNQVITRHVESGTGEGNQNDLTLHFGFGALDDDEVEAEVTWPGNHRQVVKGLKLNTRQTVSLK
ncbi:MAG: CRTAC1 family protein [Planctomycetota bacterium]|nr:CRTAC1 family protein [Planctomycetota bacterium]